MWNNAINRYNIETKYFNPNAITVTYQRFNLPTPFEKLKHALSIWTREGSGRTINKIAAIHIKISNYEPLAGSSHIPLPRKLNNSMKALINIRNKDLDCFKWCHIRLINPQNKNSERTKKQDQKIASTLDYRGINLPIKAHDSELI